MGEGWGVYGLRFSSCPCLMGMYDEALSRVCRETCDGISTGDSILLCLWICPLARLLDLQWGRNSSGLTRRGWMARGWGRRRWRGGPGEGEESRRILVVISLRDGERRARRVAGVPTSMPLLRRSCHSSALQPASVTHSLKNQKGTHE
jgi:hypothetical protein